MKQYVAPQVEIVKVDSDAFSAGYDCIYTSSNNSTPDHPVCDVGFTVMLGMGYVDACKNYNTVWVS